jgi:CubicO group peptidase (beta-lactamase class C family)
MKSTASRRRRRLSPNGVLRPRFAASLTLLLVACVRLGEAGPAPSLGLEARIAAVAPGALEEAPLSGFSVAVAQGNRVVFAKGYGFADLAAGVPAEADTVYRIGSIGKTFVAAALVRLAEEGRLSLDDPVVQLVPDLVIDPRITVRHLLSHTSGLVNLFALPGFAESQGIGMTRQEVVEWIESQPLVAEPGERWDYNNTGYLLAGVVLDEVTGGEAADYIREHIIAPAGLDHTFYCLSNSGPLKTRGYHVVGEGWDRVLRLGRPPGFVPAPPVNMPLISTAGTPCSTVSDLVTWLQQLRQGNVVSSAAYLEMSDPVILPGGKTAPYGIGLQVRDEGGRLTVGHAGLINGFVGRVEYFPAEDVTIAFLANTSPPQSPEPLWEALVEAVFGGPPGTEGVLQ